MLNTLEETFVVRLLADYVRAMAPAGALALIFFASFFLIYEPNLLFVL